MAKDNDCNFNEFIDNFCPTIRYILLTYIYAIYGQDITVAFNQIPIQ